MEEEIGSPVMKKAILITGGSVKVGADVKLPFYPSRSTAGPGAGAASIVLSFEGMRVKKAISKKVGEFELVRKDGGFRLLRDGSPFVSVVEIEPTIFHSPEQAFFNLDTDCIYDCKFCATRKLDKRITKNLDLDRIVDLVMEASKRDDFKAVAFTSAVVDSPSMTVGRLAYVISRVREELDPTISIGVEPYVESHDDIDRLRAAGADEIKINIETYDRDIFGRVCGKRDLDWLLKTIKYAVGVFGTGRVCSNIIVGLGETDENVIEGIDHLAKMGCLATLRPLRINNMNRKALEDALGHLEAVTPERIIGLAEEQRSIFELYDLDPRSFRTMCHACTCCDIVPFRDI
ncbi:MAG: radical SAM protein [Methanomassiliicoccales archaeon]|jgi:biotin synthase-related radical SAM superfamily protein